MQISCAVIRCPKTGAILLIIRFAIASTAPALCLLLACLAGGAWPLLAVLSITVVVFFLDKLTGEDGQAPSDRAGHALSVSLGALHFALLAAVIAAVSRGTHLEVSDKVLILIGAGLWFGQVSNSNAHELIHRPGRGSRRLGVAIYSSLLFGHHASAHRRVHHVFAATDKDPNSARAGEGFYRFALRAWVQGFRAGLKAENMARARAVTRQPAWSHPYVGYVTGAVLALAVAWSIGGIAGAGVLLLVSGYAIIQLLLSDYVQHYGLRRATLAGGKPAPIGPQHSWNAPQWYSGAMMLNAPRHSDHHMHPGQSFGALQMNPDAMPVLPHSLPVMAVVALIPPVWKRIMDPRAAKWMGAGAHNTAQNSAAGGHVSGDKGGTALNNMAFMDDDDARPDMPFDDMRPARGGRATHERG